MSARLRILAWVGLLLALAGVATIALQHRVLLDQLDQDIESSFSQEAEEVRVLATGRDPATGEPFNGDVAAIFDTFLERNLQNDGEVLVTFVDGRPYKATSAPYEIFDDASLIARWGALTQSDRGEVHTPAGPLRYLAVPLADLDGTRGVFVVTEFTQDELDEIASTTRIGSAVYAVVMILALILAWFVAGRVLAPVRTMTDAANEISESDLSRRIPVPQSRDEISELAKTFNGMLDRLDGAFRKQRQFLDDAGHELRTPITIVRGHLEVDQGDGDSKTLVLDELDRMSRMVDDLLTLARAEEVDFLRKTPVDIDVFTTDVFAKAKRLAERDWHFIGTAHGVIEADAHRLTQAVINLVDNAIRHTEPGSRIEIGSTIVGSSLQVHVTDQGPGIEPAEQQRIFERFAQGRDGLTKEGKAGLGLAIVAAVADAHGGNALVRSSPGNGATFEINLPVDGVS